MDMGMDPRSHAFHVFTGGKQGMIRPLDPIPFNILRQPSAEAVGSHPCLGFVYLKL